MVICPKCGFDSQEGKFCIACGQPLSNVETQSFNKQENIDNEEIKFNNPQKDMNYENANMQSDSNEYKAPEYNQFNQENNVPIQQESIPVQNNQQSNIPVQQDTQIKKPYDNQGFVNQTNRPANQKSKLVGFLLNFFIPGLGYGYVNKWKEGAIIFVIYHIIWLSGFVLLFPFLIAFVIWIYSLIKTMSMIDKYNKGLPY
ncbi:MAG: hypothetical protein BZ137_00520 [Methanosphaera sp. rholeuAM130]|nr:MAG: hypothetical protein BZ137_00520 [Methanosphaera sp. rholeuAM130]